MKSDFLMNGYAVVDSPAQGVHDHAGIDGTCFNDSRGDHELIKVRIERNITCQKAARFQVPNQLLCICSAVTMLSNKTLVNAKHGQSNHCKKCEARHDGITGKRPEGLIHSLLSATPSCWEILLQSCAKCCRFR